MSRPPFLVVHRPISSPTRPEKSRLENPKFSPPPKPSPLALAQHWLGTRFQGGDDYLRLDGRRVNLAEVMRETYRVMIAAGETPDIPNESWRP